MGRPFFILLRGAWAIGKLMCMKQISRRPATAAFSLVELSLVIVIIGILVGAVVGGKAIIRAAELRSVMTDANNYVTAANNFRTQYRYLPGDLPTATSYWSTSANGNGDNIIDGTGGEQFRFWEQLNLAGMVEKTFTGAAGGGGADHSIPGTNVPDSRIQQSGFSFFYRNDAGSTTTYVANLGNQLAYGGVVANSKPTTAILTPVDAFSMDTKMDDGVPGTGKWIANSTGSAVWGNAAACTTSTSNTDYTGAYRTTISDVASCSFYIITGY